MKIYSIDDYPISLFRAVEVSLLSTWTSHKSPVLFFVFDMLDKG